MANTWGVPKSSIEWVEKNALEPHTAVAGFHREDDLVFVIKRTEGRKPLRVLLLEEYTLGLARTLEAIREFGKVDCIVTGGMWTAYTREAKQYGIEQGIGIFNMREFLGALHRSAQIEEYALTNEKGEKEYQYRDV